MQLYDLDGRIYDEVAVMQIYVNATNEFKNENPNFIGSKFIYAPLKNVTDKTAGTYFEIVRKLHRKFPNFLAGFDLVGQEDTSRSIIDFIDSLLDLPEDINLFLHAGETNWYGSVDINMVCLNRSIERSVVANLNLINRLTPFCWARNVLVMAMRWLSIPSF